MSDPYVDTDVIVRLLTGDDLEKQQAARRLFEAVEAGDLTIAAPDTVIADAVFVLSSPRLYAQSRPQVAAMLNRLARLPGFKVGQRRTVLRALDIYAESNLDFGDATLVAAMHLAGASTLYSYDRDFDRMPGIGRVEPTS
jgi:predicted nucleic acid-binding protein